MKKKNVKRTVQSKIPTEPLGMCVEKCGRHISRDRKDKRCDNCGHFADKRTKLGKPKKKAA